LFPIPIEDLLLRVVQDTAQCRHIYALHLAELEDLFQQCRSAFGECEPLRRRWILQRLEIDLEAPS
jgi:hypothetical protein